MFSDRKETNKEEMQKAMRQNKGDNTRDNTGILGVDRVPPLKKLSLLRHVVKKRTIISVM